MKGKRVKEKAKNKEEKINKKSKQNQNKEGKKKFSKKHPVITFLLRLFLLLVIIISVIATGIVVGMLYGGWGEQFEISEDELVIGSSNSVILDKDGNKLAELSGDDNRKIIRLDQMPKDLKNAYVAIEDERFYTHNGIDIKRTGGAILQYVLHRGNSSFGGSTITQQLVKNITQDDDRTGMEGILRKLREWAKAYQIERMISKDQILELYLNIIFVGGRNNLGVEVGAEYYFNKQASELSLAQCAYLAGINHSPNSYKPFADEPNIELINNRTKTVLTKMLELEMITKEEYDGAISEINSESGLGFQKTESTGTNYSYHTDATISQVIEDIAKEKDISKSLASTYLYTSGLTIYSTQDTALQSQMNDVMVNNSSTYTRNSKLNPGTTSQSAMVIIDNQTGYVVGVVGGLGQKTESRGLNRATQSTRQTGSSIKTLTSLVPGINEGVITAATIYDDSRTEFKGNYNPKDYNTPRGLVSVREAITTSQNIPFVKVVTELTPSKSTDYLQKMGVTTVEKDRDILAALSIGGFTDGITPLEMAGAYATIANNGVYRRPLFYTKITDSDGNTVLEAKQNTEQVMSEQAAYVVKNLLQSVVQSGTATYCKISGIDVAAKTGTTNGNYDKWLCGFTNYYTASCWYGFDQNEEVTGSNNVAGRIWSAVMSKVHSGKDSSRFTQPSGVVSATICRTSGRRATGKCTDTYSEIFVEGTVPAECDAHETSAQVCSETLLLATEHCPNVITKYYSYTVDKEKLGLWNTLNSSVSTPPVDHCPTHTASNTNTTPNTAEASAPTITINGEKNITLNVGDTYSEKGASAKDDIDGDISNKIITSGAVNTSKAGTYTVKYTVTNSKGKTTTTTRTITVKAKNIPTPETPKNNTTTENTTAANTTTPPKEDTNTTTSTTTPSEETTKPTE